MSDQRGHVLHVPRELIDNCWGFSMDYGGSVIKVAYINKEDYVEDNKKNEENGSMRLRLVAFPRGELEKCLEFLLNNCYIKRDGNSPPLMFTTGLGVYQYVSQITQKLHTRLENLTEFDCFVEAFNYLMCHLTADQLLYNISSQHREEIELLRQTLIHEVCNDSTKYSGGELQTNSDDIRSLDWDVAARQWDPVTSDKPVSQVFTNLYPSLIVTFGSAVAFLHLYADGRYRMADVSYSGGLLFLGLGSVLAERNLSYNDLVDLAESRYNEDTASMQNNMNIDFEELLDKSPECFRKEDRLYALVQVMATHFTNRIYNHIMLRDYKHVFLAGSFTNRSVIRTIFAREFERTKVRSAALNEGKGLDARLHFLKVGSHLGALGALANSTLGFLGSTRQQTSNKLK